MCCGIQVQYTKQAEEADIAGRNYFDQGSSSSPNHPVKRRTSA